VLHPKPLETPVEVLKEKQLLSVTVVESRKNKEVVGAFCDDKYLFLVRDSVADLVMDALSAEFVRRGYAIDEGGAGVKIGLKEFFCYSCRPTYESRVAFEVQVCGKDGVSVYQSTV